MTASNTLGRTAQAGLPACGQRRPAHPGPGNEYLAQIGVVALVGPAAKNAMLIVGFAVPREFRALARRFSERRHTAARPALADNQAGGLR